MKKVLFIAILLLSVLSAGTALTYDSKAQLVSGYIGTRVRCNIEEFMYTDLNGGRGINLNINDPNNNHRYVIAPTQVELTTPGLMVGRFSIVSSESDIKIIVMPGMLTNVQNPNIQYEYEVSVSYKLENTASQEDHTVMCKSGSSMVLDFQNPSGVVIVNNAGIYFRLRKEISDRGDYTSNVLFQLEATR